MELVVRAETKEDYKKITDVNNKGFGQTNEGKLVESLRNTEGFEHNLSLVAVENDNVVVHILFYPVHIKSDDNDYQTLALAPMSVLPEFQGKKIGSRLITEGLKKAKEQGYKSVIVLGHANYYPKFGFKPASQWGIKAPFEVPNDVFMALELVEKSLYKTQGVVIYPKELSEV